MMTTQEKADGIDPDYISLSYAKNTVKLCLPIVILLDIGLIALGGFLDVTMYDPKPGTIGTPVPFFTAIFGIIAGIISLIGFIVMIVLMIVGAVRLSKSTKKTNTPQP